MCIWDVLRLHASEVHLMGPFLLAGRPHSLLTCVFAHTTITLVNLMYMCILRTLSGQFLVVYLKIVLLTAQ